MALKKIRIGSAEDIFQYDDGGYGTAIDTDGQPIEIGPSAAATQAVRQDQLPTLGSEITSDAVIADHSIVRGDGGARKIQDSNVLIDDSGSVYIPTGQSYKVNNIQILTDQQSAESNAAAISAVTITPGSSTLNIIATNATLSTLVSEINSLRSTVNSLLAKLRTHGIINT